MLNFFWISLYGCKPIFFKEVIIKLEDLTGKKLTAKGLKSAMEKISKKRTQMRRVYETRKIDPVPISGKDSLLISQVAFYDDPDRQIEMIGLSFFL